MAGGGFDPERYLRLAGERLLLGGRSAWGNRPPWDTPLMEAAAALVAAGVIDLERAERVVDDYQAALALRGGHRPAWRFRNRRVVGPSGPAGAPPALGPARVIACDRRVQYDWGSLTVHYVALGPRGTAVGITVVGQAAAVIGRPRAGPGLAANQVHLTDDRGTTVVAGFSGGGNGDGYVGRLTSTQPLAATTAWIDLDQNRIDLDPAGAPAAGPPTVRVEALPEADPALRHLSAQLVTARHQGLRHGRPPSVEPAAAALVAAGVLSPDAPGLALIRQVAAAFGATPPHRGPPPPPGAGSAGPTGSLPAPWGPLLAGRWREDGPTGTVALGVVTPAVDGMVVELVALRSWADGFEVHLAVSPDWALPSGPFPTGPGRAGLALWAEDDRGHHHLGQVTSSGGGAGRAEATVTFWPPLDPAARELRLLPTGPTARAVVTVALPEWGTTS